MNASPKYLVLCLKLLVTIALVAFIVLKADWPQLFATLSTANRFYLIVVFLLMVLCVFLSAWKWRLLLGIHGADFPFWQLNRWYFVAMFFNNFLPTSIGGDGYRVWRTFRNQRSGTSALLAVLVERVSGILTLLGIGLVGALVGWMSHGHPLSINYSLLGIAGVIVALVLFWWLFFTDGLGRIRNWKRLPIKVRNVIDHIGDYTRDPVGSLQVLVLVSVLFHAVSLFWLGLLLRAVGDSIALADLALVAAIISIIAVLPLSINGIGVVDGAFILLTGQFGVSYEAALGAMLLQRVFLIPISLVGAWFYFRDGGRRAMDSV